MLFYYNEHPELPCIYEIRNTHTDRKYIGQTIKLRRRWTRGHKESLLRNAHGNKYLQNDFNKCFKELEHTDFLEFRVLEELSSILPEIRAERELYWIKTQAQFCELYNAILELDCHYAMSSETKKKVSDAKKTYCQTEEGKAFIVREAERRRGKSYEEQYGPERAAEIKQKIREDKLVVMNRPEVKENLRKQLIGATNVKRYGIEKAKLVKEKMSLARKGRYSGMDSPNLKTIENIQLLSPAGELFTKVEGIKIFALEHELAPNKLSELLAGKRKTHKGWRLINNTIQDNTFVSKPGTGRK